VRDGGIPAAIELTAAPGLAAAPQPSRARVGGNPLLAPTGRTRSRCSGLATWPIAPELTGSTSPIPNPMSCRQVMARNSRVVRPTLIHQKPGQPPWRDGRPGFSGH